jgi:hypothetical protein
MPNVNLNPERAINFNNMERKKNVILKQAPAIRRTPRREINHAAILSALL